MLLLALGGRSEVRRRPQDPLPSQIPRGRRRRRGARENLPPCLSVPGSVRPEPSAPVLRGPQSRASPAASGPPGLGGLGHQRCPSGRRHLPRMQVGAVAVDPRGPRVLHPGAVPSGRSGARWSQTSAPGHCHDRPVADPRDAIPAGPQRGRPPLFGPAASQRGWSRGLGVQVVR